MHHETFDADRATSDRGASFWTQVFYAARRSLIQQYRTATGIGLELGVAVLAGGMMGAASFAVPSLYMGILKSPYVYISPSPIENLLPSIGLFVALVIGVAASPADVKIDLWRGARGVISGGERGPKPLRLLHGKVCRRDPATNEKGAFQFVSVFHFLAVPTTGFELLFVNVWCQYFCIYGLSAITSMLVKRENAALGDSPIMSKTKNNVQRQRLRHRRHWLRLPHTRARLSCGVESGKQR